MFLGFAAAVLRVRAVDAPVLQQVLVSPMEGFVESVEERPTGGRLLVRPLTIERLGAAPPPTRVRVTARSLDGIRSGDWIRATVRLLPPPEPARPGGYDFARDSFFRGIGAVGSVSGRLSRIEPKSSPGPWLTLSAVVDRARNDLTGRIAGAIGGQPGAVAAALVTGKRGLIEEPTNDALRAAGIYHIVSISGLHMVLAAGVFFSFTRALLALSPALALGWPLKKIAACVGMAGATAYNFFSGSEIATERSLIMILVMQGAILFDRPALSLRNLAISALIVLTLHPEALLGPSFQMSYAAVAALIAMAEWFRARRDPGEEGWVARAWRWVVATMVGLLLTTLVAGLATGPFGAYHFQTLQPYGLLGNAVTLPLVSLVVMPFGVLGVVALPFGLDRPIWAVMGYAVGAVLSLAGWVAGIRARRRS
jgi:competence protein ComEC